MRSREVFTPNERDLANLRYIMSNINVGTSDEEVLRRMKLRFKAAKQKDGLTPSQGTIDNWCSAAVEIHRENQNDFSKIMAGDFT